MAWYEGNLTAAEGQLIAVLDARLPLNSKWSIYDAAAGANAKVYRCLDAAANVEFYLYVDDNQADFAILQLWQGWDAVGHAGIGQSIIQINTKNIHIKKFAGGYGLSLRNHRFIYSDTVNYMSTYIGQPKRYDVTKNIPIIIANTTATGKINPLGFYNQDTTAGWACLFDEGGTVREIQPYAWGSARLFIKTIGGTFLVLESPIINSVTQSVLGLLEGCTYHFNTVLGLYNGDIVWAGGNPWLACGGGAASPKYITLIEKV